ncbi:MAG TPA: hypothetical protein VN841_18215 [Bryobacteraceae bacterium]|nr:hypothetical protein [Bryobacteraceae bacterium]
MKTIRKTALLLCLTAAFGFGENISGTLLDANCQPVADKNAPSDAPPSCSPKGSTTEFAVKTSAGKIYRLDGAGNARVASALKSDPGRTNVTVSGKIEGQTITVESIDIT